MESLSEKHWRMPVKKTDFGNFRRDEDSINEIN